MGSRHAVERPPRSRVGLLLLTLATACGLWFGVSAPEVSPVSPVPAIEGTPGLGAGVAP